MTSRWTRHLGIALVALTLSFPLMLGCATTAFAGAARVEGGPRGCYHKCRDQRMEMESFVYMGEYSTACVCRLRPRRAVAAMPRAPEQPWAW